MVQLDSSAKIDYWDQQREEHCHLCTRRLPEKHVYHLNAILTCYYSTMTHYFIMPFLLGNRKQYDEADAVLKYHSSQRLDLGALLTGIATGCGCKVEQMRQETNHTPLSGAVVVPKLGV